MSRNYNNEKGYKNRSNNTLILHQRLLKMEELLQELNKFDKTYSLAYIKKCAYAMSLAIEYACIPHSKQEEDLIAKKIKTFKDICRRCLAFCELTDITFFSYEFIKFIHSHLIQIVNISSMNRNDFIKYWNSLNDEYLNIPTTGNFI